MEEQHGMAHAAVLNEQERFRADLLDIFKRLVALETTQGRHDERISSFEALVTEIKKDLAEISADVKALALAGPKKAQDRQEALAREVIKYLVLAGLGAALYFK
jgi:predicted  nucleic acid-binding Zn-ribbon protein